MYFIDKQRADLNLYLVLFYFSPFFAGLKNTCEGRDLHRCCAVACEQQPFLVIWGTKAEPATVPKNLRCIRSRDGLFKAGQNAQVERWQLQINSVIIGVGVACLSVYPFAQHKPLKKRESFLLFYIHLLVTFQSCSQTDAAALIDQIFLF